MRAQRGAGVKETVDAQRGAGVKETVEAQRAAGVKDRWIQNIT